MAATAYWKAQVDELTTDDVAVFEDDSRVLVRIIGNNTPEERAKLIRSLERAGLVVNGSVHNKYISVDATAEPLKHDFADVEYDA